MDLRTTWLGLAAWAGTLLGLLAPWPWALVVTAVVVAGWSGWSGGSGRRGGERGRRRGRLSTVLLLVAVLTCAGAGLRAASSRVGPVPGWAAERAVVTADLTVRSDPVVRSGRYGDLVVARGRLHRVLARGQLVTLSVPVLLIAGPEWSRVRLGSAVRVTGRLAPALSGREAAVLDVSGPPVVQRGPPWWLRGAESVRAAVRDAAAGGPGGGAVLVPALVTGDDQALPADLVEDFRTSGLTHLTAVSGTNLTLVLAFLLLLARLAGVRARGLLVVGLLGVVGFVLMARPEPSVVRAAAMGTVALLGLGAGGARGVACGPWERPPSDCWCWTPGWPCRPVSRCR